jgi:hypothetical protein
MGTWSCSDSTVPHTGGTFNFPKNEGTTEKEYYIYYTDDNGCSGSTKYTVGTGCTPCQSAFTYTTVSGCLDWARHEVSSNDIVSAETESYTITGESKDCNGNYKEVTFSCAEGPNTLWTADITHTGTSYTAKVYRKMGVYQTYIGGVPSTLTNGQGENYIFNVCTNKLTITANAYIVDQDGRKISQWGSDNPTAYGVQVDTNGVPLDESAEFRFKIDTREARTTSIHSCGSIGYIQQDATVVVTIAAGSKTASDTYPASAVAWMEVTESGYHPCYPPYEYYTRHVAITETLTSQVETTKYIIKVNDGY